MTSKLTAVAAWVGAILSIAFLIATVVTGGNPAQLFGSTATAGTIVPQGDWGGIQIGPQSQTPLLKAQIIGTCNLAEVTAGSMPATSTQQFQCQVGAGNYIKPTDLVQVSLMNGHASAFGAFDVVDATASTTAYGQNGYINVTLLNNVGAATSSYPLATTSAQFEINRI